MDGGHGVLAAGRDDATGDEVIAYINRYAYIALYVYLYLYIVYNYILSRTRIVAIAYSPHDATTPPVMRLYPEASGLVFGSGRLAALAFDYKYVIYIVAYVDGGHGVFAARCDDAASVEVTAYTNIYIYIYIYLCIYRYIYI